MGDVAAISRAITQISMRDEHPPPSAVVQSTELPSLGTERHLVFPLKVSFPLHKGDLVGVLEILRFALDDKKREIKNEEASHQRRETSSHLKNHHYAKNFFPTVFLNSIIIF